MEEALAENSVEAELLTADCGKSCFVSINMLTCLLCFYKYKLYVLVISLSVSGLLRPGLLCAQLLVKLGLLVPTWWYVLPFSCIWPLWKHSQQ